MSWRVSPESEASAVGGSESLGRLKRLLFCCVVATITSVHLCFEGVLHFDPEFLLGDVIASYFVFLKGWLSFLAFTLIAVLMVSRSLQCVSRICCCGCGGSDADDDDDTRWCSTTDNVFLQTVLRCIQAVLECLLYPRRLYKRTFGDDSDFGVYGKY